MGRISQTKWSESGIQKTLSLMFLSMNTKKYEMFNMFVYGWESDYLTITKSGYAYECEIKISRGDFFNDLKKYGKHMILEGRESSETTPNYFYYAVPEGLVKPEETPEYAGLIYVRSYGIEIVKTAPKINPEKQDLIRLNLIDKFYYRLMDRELKLEKSSGPVLEKKIRNLENDIIDYDKMLSERESEISELKREIDDLKKKLNGMPG